MNESSYNNVIRSNSPFSPMSPSTPSGAAYKTNVNRTKTRKWVEAKMQSYDGDDWGNDFEDEEDEPEEAPPPKVTGLRQPGQSNYHSVSQSAPRTFSQPAAAANSPLPSQSGNRNPSGPPALHIQTQQGPRSGSQSSAGSRPWMEPQRSASPAQGAGDPAKPQHFVRPSDIYSRIGEKEKNRQSIDAGRLNMDGTQGRSDGASSPTDAMRLPPDQRQGTGFGSNDGDNKRVDPRPMSTSPKLPDLTRMSGFGDDFFSSSGRLSPQGARPAPAGARLSFSARQDEKGRDSARSSAEKQLPSMLDGPKLEPNPDIRLPPVGAQSKEDPVVASRQDTSPRPQLPGTWVSETPTAGSDQPTSMENAEGFGTVPRGSNANARMSVVGMNSIEPADIEPTTTRKQLPSQNRDSGAVANTQATHEYAGDAFNGAPGEHDSAVASQVVAGGPGYHPTPRSLPPLQTEIPSATSNKLPKDQNEKAVPDDMAPQQSTSKGSPVRSSASTQPSATSAGSGVPPIAPLNPHRSVVEPVEILTPVIQEQSYTMSTINTASPEKESDKLREEIIKSLSSSPANTPGAGGILGQAHNSSDPHPGNLTRESTYLSGVYDDYLTPAEEKSLQETGQYLKQESMASTQGADGSLANPGSNSQKETSTPGIAPLASRKSPGPETASRQRRFSWEQGAEQVTISPVEGNPATSVLSSGPDPRNQGSNGAAPPVGQSDALAPAPDTLQPHSEGHNTITHQVSQVSIRAPGDESLTVLEPPSPISPIADKRASQLSFAEEKEQVLIHSESSTSEEHHPALSPRPIESPGVLSPPAQVTAQAKVMSFRDILNVDSTEERIRKFDETRAQFYSMDSGLSNWILHMKSQPEHGGAAISTAGQPGGPLGQGQHSPSSAGPPTQQPYYQQYLNASSPNAPAGQSGRQSAGNLQQMFSGQPTSGFGSSGNQVGTKSKELLHAAGAFGNKGMKSGMKLFNKGRSKLRGTGDKGFH
ncbi:hypothetical protein F5B20DRAFT_572048 [Whalleya microplaca]|nr:hypothetical protein F5B20DRAFT_572048 [Whalleya microplaca]